MVRNILLTYEHVDGYSTYGWFEDIEEIDIFISTTNQVKALLECFDCTSAKIINLEELGKEE